MVYRSTVMSFLIECMKLTDDKPYSTHGNMVQNSLGNGFAITSILLSKEQEKICQTDWWTISMGEFISITFMSIEYPCDI